MLKIIDHVPYGLLSMEVADLYGHLGGPTLIHLEGELKEPLFVSCLLHGNEFSGWLAVREVLKKYEETSLPRSLSIFIGNVSAAEWGMRHLDGQPDYNRIWKYGDSDEAIMAQNVLDEMRQRNIFAAIDIHNNTGLNPHYACINNLDNRFVHLAKQFSRTIVYFIKPDSVCSLAFAGLCPSITVECGQPGDSKGVKHVVDLILNTLAMPHHDISEVHEQSVDIFHTTAIVRLPRDVSFSFNQEPADIHFIETLDHLNFRELPPGTLLGKLSTDSVVLEAWNEIDQNISGHYFTFENNEIRTRIAVMPSMLTLDTRVIRQDCLCYLMERYS